jgi:hypothetical protein
MSYVSWATIKAFKGYPDNAIQTAMEAIVARAQTIIDNYMGRTFEAAADTTRYFDAVRDTDGRTLYFDRDLCQITTVTNNADNGSGGTVITASQYTTLPRSETPYYAIKLLSSSGLSWTYTNDPEMGITVKGRWAYSVTAPGWCEQACLRLALYLYELKDSQVFDVTAMPDAGQIVLPKGIPADVKAILDSGPRRVA